MGSESVASMKPRIASRAQLPDRVQVLGPLLQRVRPAFMGVFFKRLLRVERAVVDSEIGPLFVDPVSHFGGAIVRDGCYEPSMMATLRRLLPVGGVFADIGANEGFFSIMASKLVGPTGRVIAVEPQRRLGQVLRENIALNRLDNVLVSAVAVGDKEGTAELHLSPDVNTGATGLVRATKYGLPTQTTVVTRLTTALASAGIAAVDLLKMDIEGSEYEAILGSPELFKTGAIRALALELHPERLRARGLDANRILAFLHECGYREDASFGNAVFMWHSPLP